MKRADSHWILASLVLLVLGAHPRTSSAEEKGAPPATQAASAEEEDQAQREGASKAEAPPHEGSEIAQQGLPPVKPQGTATLPKLLDLPSGGAKTGVSSQAI
jgi:hypothetical protein